MFSLHVNFDARLFLRKVFATSRRATPVSFPAYLQTALEKNKIAAEPGVLKRLRRLSYKSLRKELADDGVFRLIVETMLNERPDLLAQLLSDVYHGKVGDLTDSKYLHKIVAAHAYPKEAALAIVDRELAERNAASVIYSKL